MLRVRLNKMKKSLILEYLRITMVAFIVSASFYLFMAIYSGLDLLEQYSSRGMEGLNGGELAAYFLEGKEKKFLFEKIMYVFSYPFEPFWQSFVLSFFTSFVLIIFSASILRFWRDR